MTEKARDGETGDSTECRKCMIHYKADAIAATEMRALDTFALVLAERADGAGLRLEIQIALAFDQQDIALGQDTYCLVNVSGPRRRGWDGTRNEWRRVDASGLVAQPGESLD